MTAVTNEEHACGWCDLGPEDCRLARVKCCPNCDHEATWVCDHDYAPCPLCPPQAQPHISAATNPDRGADVRGGESEER